MHYFGEFGTVGELHILLREVEFEFEESGQVEQFVAQAVQFGRVASAHLVHGDAVRGAVRRGDDVGDTFGLCEVEFAGQECPNGKFTRGSGPGTVSDEQLDDP